MSSFFLYDNVVCPAFPTKNDIETGHPKAFSYIENLSATGGDSGTKLKITGDDVCRVPADNGDSWTVDDAHGAARGAYVYIEVVGPVDLNEVGRRLDATRKNQKRVLSGGQPVTPPVEIEEGEHPPEQSNLPPATKPATAGAELAQWQIDTKPDGS